MPLTAWTTKKVPKDFSKILVSIPLKALNQKKPFMLIYNINITMFLVFKKEIKFVLFQNFGEKNEISVIQGSLIDP